MDAPASHELGRCIYNLCTDLQMKYTQLAQAVHLLIHRIESFPHICVCKYPPLCNPSLYRATEELGVPISTAPAIFRMDDNCYLPGNIRAQIQPAAPGHVLYLDDVQLMTQNYSSKQQHMDEHRDARKEWSHTPMFYFRCDVPVC